MAWVVNGVRLVESHLSVYNAVKRLSKKKGYCTAWNEQIGNDWMVNKSGSRVGHILSDLRKAGLVSVLCIYAEHRNFVKLRKLAIVGDFLNAVNPILSSLATNNDKHSLECTNNKNNNQDKKDAAIKNAMETARKLRISWWRVLIAIRKYGIRYVQEKLAIVANSRSATNAVAYFIAALKNDWKPNKRASKKVGQVCDYTRTNVYTVNYENHEADAIIKTRSLNEIRQDSPFAKFLH